MLTYELKVIASQIPVEIIKTDGEELDNVHQEIKLPYGLITFDLTTRIYRNPGRALTLSEGYSGVEYEPGEIDFEVDNVHLWDGRERDLDLDDQSYWYLAETIKSKLIVQ